MEAREGWSAGSDPGNGSKAMKKTNGIKEVDVYRSSTLIQALIKG